jgi:hypothetical protein
MDTIDRLDRATISYDAPVNEAENDEHDDYLPSVDEVLIDAQLGSTSTITGSATATIDPLDLSKTFALNSLAGSNFTIYLDFDGHTTTNTYWNDSANPSIVTPAYDFDGNTAAFSTTELTRIQYIWQRVAEDFSPFNVNVTTQAPTDINDLTKNGTNDPRWGIRVAIGGSSYDWYDAGAGGVAYVGSFNWSTDTPAFVFTQQLGGGNEKYTAEAISHEVGHTLGLNHDGRKSPVEGYYKGQGAGETGWASIMGVGYYQNLSQWSKGEYTSASNLEDDLQIITTRNGFGYRVDDTGNNLGTAKALVLAGNAVSADGIIERNTDADFYSFGSDAGAITLNVSPVARGANLDILAELYSADGTLIATSNPIDGLAATISTTLATAGTYYLKIDGVGKGDPLATGYSDYGSLGQYSISGNIIPPSQQSVSLGLAATSVQEDGTTSLVYTFTRTGDTTNEFTVDYQVAGTATFGSDYNQSGAASFTATTGTITFAAGAATATLTIEPTADGLIEGDETVALTLMSDPNYVIATPATVTGTILNDDVPAVISLALATDNALEDGAANLAYTFTRTGNNLSALTVNYKISGSATVIASATTVVDYIQSGQTSFNTGNKTGTITFAAGASNATLTIDPTADTTLENNKTVGVTLKTGDGYTLGTTAVVTGTIVDDELPIVTLAAAPASVLEDGTTNIEYTFARTGSIAQALIVKYGVNGTAVFNDDYTQTGARTFTTTSGTITFAAGAATAKLTLDPKADSVFEANETIGITLQKASGYNIGPTKTITAAILNDDIAPISPTGARGTIFAADELPQAELPQLVDGLSLDLSQIVAPLVQISFSIDRDAAYNNSVGFYRALDASGAIETSQGILIPSDAGYVQAALQNSLALALQSGLTLGADNGKQANVSVDLDTSSYYLPILVANGTLADAANGGNLNAYTAFASANADKLEHIRSIGNSTFGFDDTFGGGDRDFNDLIIKASIGQLTVNS